MWPKWFVPKFRSASFSAKLWIADVVALARTAAAVAGWVKSRPTRAGARPPSSRAASVAPSAKPVVPAMPGVRSARYPPAAPKARLAPMADRPPKSPKLDAALRRAVVPVAEACAGQHFAVCIVKDIAVRVDQAVLTVTRIGIKRNIGKDADVRHSILDRLGRPAHEVVGVQRFPSILAALLGRRVGEEGEAGYARITRFPRARDDQVDGPARHARQAGHGFLNLFAFRDEEWPDQVLRANAVFREHGAAPCRRAGAAHADGGKGCVGHDAV